MPYITGSIINFINIINIVGVCMTTVSHHQKVYIVVQSTALYKMLGSIQYLTKFGIKNAPCHIPDIHEYDSFVWMLQMKQPISIPMPMDNPITEAFRIKRNKVAIDPIIILNNIIFLIHMMFVCKIIIILSCGQTKSVRKACEGLKIFSHRHFLFATPGKKKGVNQLCCYNLGIAKHLYTYNSEAHTLEGVSIRFPLLKCTI